MSMIYAGKRNFIKFIQDNKPDIGESNKGDLWHKPGMNLYYFNGIRWEVKIKFIDIEHEFVYTNPTNYIQENSDIGTVFEDGEVHLIGQENYILDEYEDSTHFLGSLIVEVNFNRMYVLSRAGDWLSVFDISNPEDIQILGHLADAHFNSSSGMAIIDELLYITSRLNKSLTVVDCTDMINFDVSQIVSSVQDSTILDKAHGVAVSNGYAYVVSEDSNTFTVINISDPTNLTIVNAISHPTYLFGAMSIFISGTYAYVGAYYGNRLTIINIGNPEHPSIVSSMDGLSGISSVYVQDDKAYVASSLDHTLTIIDVSNKTSPAINKRMTDNVNLNGIKDVVVIDNYAFVVSYFTKLLSIIDVSDSSAPRIVNSILDDRLDGCESICRSVDGKYIYITSEKTNRVMIIDVETPLEIPFRYKNIITTQSFYVNSTDSVHIDIANVVSIIDCKIIQDEPSGTEVRYLVSVNNRQTWQRWNGSTWMNESSDLSTISENGNTAYEIETNLSSIPMSAYQYLDIAFSLKSSDSTKTPNVEKIIVTLN